MLQKIKNLFKKQETISFKTRALLLSFVGIVFLVVFFLSIYNQYITDTLVDYLPDETVLYAHFNLPKLNKSDEFNQTLYQILSQNNLGDFNTIDIKREVALVGILIENELLYATIIRTDRPYRVKNFLDERGYRYEFLSGSVVVVSADAGVLDIFAKNKKNKVALETKNKFSWFNSLSVYISPALVSYQDKNVLLDLFYYDFASSDGNVYLNIKVKKDGVVACSESNKQKIKLVRSGNHDLIISAENLGQTFNNWQDDLENIAEEEYDLWQMFWQPVKEKYFISEALEKKILSSEILLLADKKVDDTGQTDWVFGNYDYYLRLDQVRFDTSDQREIETIIKSIMAWQFPEPEDLRLSDGTIVTELKPNIESWEFIVDEEGYSNLIAPDLSTSFIYKLDNKKLEIASDKKFFELADNRSYNYLKISTSFLGDEFWQYVRNFGFIEIKS